MVRKWAAFILLITLLFGVFSPMAQAASLTATLETNRGTIVIELTPDQTPKTVASFVNLIQRGYYDGLTFHRVIADFVIQGGDPSGNGTGGPGYQFEDEFDPSLKHSDAGILSMANAGPRTNGSQFFITLAAQPHLNGKHTVFGKVVQGLDVVESIKQGDKIVKATVTGDTTELFKKVGADLEKWNAILNQKFPIKK